VSAPKSPAVRRNRASAAALERWAREPDPVAATQAARDGRWQRYLDKARQLALSGASDEDIERRADRLRRADLHRMALASAKARGARARKAAAEPEPDEAA
jgi:hypothetical protein